MGAAACGSMSTAIAAAIASWTSLADRLRVGLLASHDDGGAVSEAGGGAPGGAKASRVLSRGGWLRRAGRALSELNELSAGSDGSGLGRVVGGASASMRGSEAPGANGLVAAGATIVGGIDNGGEVVARGVGGVVHGGGGGAFGASSSPKLSAPSDGGASEGLWGGAGGDVMAGAESGVPPKLGEDDGAAAIGGVGAGPPVNGIPRGGSSPKAGVPAAAVDGGADEGSGPGKSARTGPRTTGSVAGGPSSLAKSMSTLTSTSRSISLSGAGGGDALAGLGGSEPDHS